jgi:hypothetical protein
LQQPFPLAPVAREIRHQFLEIEHVSELLLCGTGPTNRLYGNLLLRCTKKEIERLRLILRFPYPSRASPDARHFD